MTSPPSRETGATAEAVAREIAERLVFRQDFHSDEAWKRTVEAEALCKVLPILAVRFDAIRRSAHLEDARAGCAVCAGGSCAGMIHDKQPQRAPRDGVDVLKGGWAHEVRNTAGGESWWIRCLRPEVWDALSLPPGGK